MKKHFFKNFFIPLICALLCLALGTASGLSTVPEIEGWYAGLNKPSFNPPNWIFGPVWTLLYLMMGGALGLIINLGTKTPGVKTALVIFALQFILNLVWTPVFFGMHQIFPALIVITFLWVATLLSIIHFLKLRPLAGWLLVPYLLWVSFATLLNASLWRLNLS